MERAEAIANLRTSLNLDYLREIPAQLSRDGHSSHKLPPIALQEADHIGDLHFADGKEGATFAPIESA